MLGQGQVQGNLHSIKWYLGRISEHIVENSTLSTFCQSNDPKGDL